MQVRCRLAQGNTSIGHMAVDSELVGAGRVYSVYVYDEELSQTLDPESAESNDRVPIQDIRIPFVRFADGGGNEEICLLVNQLQDVAWAPEFTFQDDIKHLLNERASEYWIGMPAASLIETCMVRPEDSALMFDNMGMEEQRGILGMIDSFLRESIISATLPLPGQPEPTSWDPLSVVERALDLEVDKKSDLR